MSDTTIEWTRGRDGSKGKSWNPIAAYSGGKRGWMCTKPSTGCTHCYAETMNVRLGNGLRYTVANAQSVEWRLHNLDEPAGWKKPRMVFVESMSDLFHEYIPEQMVQCVWEQMLELPRHTFQVLTKRPERMAELIIQWRHDPTVRRGRSDAHIWLGVSAENQIEYLRRWTALERIPATVRFVSVEPMLEHIDISHSISHSVTAGRLTSHPVAYPDWIIAGGESGKGARPLQRAWIDQMMQQCQAAGVPLFIKQLGAAYHEITPVLLRDAKGGDWNEWSVELRIRQWPASIGKDE